MPSRVAALVAVGLASASASVLRDGDTMRPDVVASTLAQVEEEWKAEAAAFLEGSASEAKAAPNSFSKSCSTVVSAVIQGSGGDRNVAKEYMNNVCNQKALGGWHKLRCTSLAASITDQAMHADSYANRENMNPSKVCTGFWSVFVKEEQNRVAEEAKVKAEQDKIRAEEEKKAAIAKAEADKKAEAEAKVEAERVAKVEAEREKVEKAEKAQRDATEAKARLAEAAEKLAIKKAAAEQMQKEAQAKLEEAKKAEDEHKARLAEHKEAEKFLDEKAQKEKAAPVVAAVAKKEEAAPVVVAKKEAAPLVAAVAKKEEAAPVVAAVAKKEEAAPVKAVAPVKAAAAVVAKPAFLEQDPCAGCTEGLSQAYQTCASKHGNPCAETNAAGLVISGPGTKKDVGCCMKKEKHDRCLKCSGMDCAHGTCKVNKKYYNQRTIGEGPLDDKKAMKKAGWGK